ncbi:MAG: C25 family cysteine peptidase, partial [Perlabentimonas sp.]
MLLLVMAFSGSSQNQKIIFDEQTSQKHGATIISERSESVTIKFNLNELDLHEVNTQNGAAYTISSTNAANVLQKGYPDLFYLAQSIIIPNKGSVEIESITGNYEEFNDIEVAPSKGNLKRNVDPNQVPFEKGKIYQVNEFYPKDLANLREPFILRDFRGQSIQVNPVQYNPVTKTLRVYKDLTINVKYTDGNGVNELTGGKTASSIETEFAHVYSSMFLNFNNEKYTVIGEDGELLIICYDDFVDTMQPFVNWKRTIGRNTTIVPVSEVGSTSAAIKDYIQDYYDDPDNNLTHVLLVGDAPQIPTNSISNGDSDNYYGYLEGTDSYSEIIIGRFSAETVAHVETQVQRMIEYERDMTEEDTWLNVGMGVARNEGSGGGHNGGEADYEHMDFIRDTLLNYTYVEVHKEYDGDVPGETNTTPSEISTGINDGVSVINYCNHGLVTGWSVAGYSSSHVDQLTNTGKLPYIWAVACVNGDFVTNTCFAETWLRATHNGEPSGAIGTMMSTINQDWQPPMTGQDEMVGILSESFEDNIKRTFGGLSINGSMKMLDLHGESGIQTHDTWTLFGDPTLLVRTDTPQQMNVSHNPTMFLGSDTF